MKQLRKSADRGHFNHGWLNTYHTFSFADYHDPNHRGFSFLRVINEDTVAPGQGFATHSHADMEIITYVMAGTLAHKDSMGNGSLIKPGDVQYMSAGSGVTHSEFNATEDQNVHLLQIWIRPAEKGATPRYDQKNFPKEAKQGKWCLLASPDGREGSIAIRQDASLSALFLSRDQEISTQVQSDRRYWLHVVQGECEANGDKLNSGDALGLEAESSLILKSISAETEILLFDLP